MAISVDELVEGELIPLQFDSFTVALSAMVSVFGSYVALQMFERAMLVEATRWKLLFMFFSAFCIGGFAIWAMHFIGMSAVNTGVHINFRTAHTLGSVFLAIFSCFCGLLIKGIPHMDHRINYKSPMWYTRHFAGAAFITVGVCGMHYLGMVGMTGPVIPRPDLLLVILSVVVCFTAATAGLFLLYYTKEELRRFICPFVIALAVCSMHYLGVVGWRFEYAPDVDTDPDSISTVGMGTTTAVFCVILCAVFLIVLESLERQRRQVMQNIVRFRTRQLVSEKERGDMILYNMLPAHVADSLKSGEHFKPERFERATFVFSDIVGFTRMSAQSTPDQCIRTLNNLFTYYDAIIKHYGAFKYETVGDCYVACLFKEPDPRKCATKMLQIALMAHEIPNHCDMSHMPEQVRFRCGVHIGPIVAGVIGNDRPKYNFAGDTINTASRMESTARNGCTQISDSMFDLVQEDPDFIFTKQNGVEVKGKGLMTTYYVESRTGGILDTSILTNYMNALSEKDKKLEKLQKESIDMEKSMEDLTDSPQASGNMLEKYFSRLGPGRNSVKPKPAAKLGKDDVEMGAANELLLELCFQAFIDCT